MMIGGIYPFQYEANSGFFVWRKALPGASGFYSFEINKKRL
jgi:hypothetical protein